MPHAATPRHHRAGFTMIEVLLVVAMIGVMVAVIGPKFRLNQSTEVQLAAMQMAQDLELARTRALATRSEVRFVFETGVTPNAYSGYLDANQDGTIAETADERTALRGFGRRPLPPRVAYGRGAADPLPTDPYGNPVTFASDRVLFTTRGITEPLGTSGVIYMHSTTDSNHAAAIEISGSGAIRYWTWRDGSWQ